MSKFNKILIFITIITNMTMIAKELTEASFTVAFFFSFNGSWDFWGHGIMQV